MRNVANLTISVHSGMDLWIGPNRTKAYETHDEAKR
jgi:hypothetical protein